MSEPRISPPPWTVKLTEEINVYSGDDWVALTAYAGTDAIYWEQSLGDARLIAAAPELLYAARVMLLFAETYRELHPESERGSSINHHIARVREILAPFGEDVSSKTVQEPSE